MLETRDVKLTVESVHIFRIPNTRSDEEAILLAERLYLEDGELGDSAQATIVNSEIVSDDEAPMERSGRDKSVSMLSSEAENFEERLRAWEEHQAEWN